MSAVRKLFGRWSGRRGTSRVPQPVSAGGTARSVRALLPLAVLAAGVTAGCGGGSELSIERPVGEAEQETELLELSFPAGQPKEYRLPFRISGGFLPYESSIEGCPEWVTLLPDQGVLAGTAPRQEQGKTFHCTYRVTEADPGFRPQRSVSYGLQLIVGPHDRGAWRFRTRTVEPGGPCALRSAGISTPVAILPHAQGGEAGEDVYNLIDFPEDHFLSFDPDTRRLTYTHPSADPIVGTPNTYRYLAGTEQSVNAANADDALCLDIRYNPGPSAMCGDPDADPAIDPDYFIHIQLQVRDDAFWDENAREYRCPDSTAPEPRSDAQSVSNPVHTALAPVHARRAVDVAHTAVRDRVRNWSRGDARTLTAIAPALGLASLSGESGGFDYSGSSESLSAGAELGASGWQAGVLASVTWTELHYRAGASLAERGYRSGEHDTEFLSMHPFAAWHASSGGHVWASVGAGTGELRHRDDLGFPSWSRSDARLLTSAVGGSLPLAELFHGELQAEAGIETFVLEIEGGGRISSSLPTMRGRDYRAGLAWSAPLPGSPSMSMGYKHLTGVGADGGSLEVQGSFSVAEIFDPRLSLTGSVEASFGLGENDQNLWGLGAGLRFAPNGLGRGFGLDVDSRLMPSADEHSSGLSIRGEAGYGLGGGPFGTIRPYAGLIGNSRHQLVQQTLGLALRETPSTAVKIEFRERPAIDRALMFTLWQRL